MRFLCRSITLNTMNGHGTSMITEKLNVENQFVTLIHVYSVCISACMPHNQRHDDTF